MLFFSLRACSSERGFCRELVQSGRKRQRRRVLCLRSLQIMPPVGALGLCLSRLLDLTFSNVPPLPIWAHYNTINVVFISLLLVFYVLFGPKWLVFPGNDHFLDYFKGCLFSVCAGGDRWRKHEGSRRKMTKTNPLNSTQTPMRFNDRKQTKKKNLDLFHISIV